MGKTVSATQETGRASLITCLTILILTLISLILLRLHTGGFWIYTSIISLVIALIAIGYNIYLNFRTKSSQRISILRQVIYWIGFLAAVYIDALMVRYGVTSTTSAGLFTLLLLAVAFFFIGITDDLSFALVGITIALMVVGSIVIKAYVLLVIIPITVIMGLLIFLLIRTNKNRTVKSA